MKAMKGCLTAANAIEAAAPECGLFMRRAAINKGLEAKNKPARRTDMITSHSTAMYCFNIGNGIEYAVYITF